MTDDSLPLVPSPNPTEQQSSSWTFDDLHEENLFNKSDDFFSVLKQNIEKNVYFNRKDMNNKDKQSSENFTNHQRSTQRLDSSDLISRCKQFLPLLTDANRNLFSKIQAGENVRMELDDENDEERTIEMNLMFCPNMDSSSSSESDNDEDEINTKSILLSQNKKANLVNIVEIESLNQLEDHINN